MGYIKEGGSFRGEILYDSVIVRNDFGRSFIVRAHDFNIRRVARVCRQGGGFNDGHKALHDMVKSLPTSLCPPGQRPSWAGGKREGVFSPLERGKV
jgi:hypothetical protein